MNEIIIEITDEEWKKINEIAKRENIQPEDVPSFLLTPVLELYNNLEHLVEHFNELLKGMPWKLDIILQPPLKK